MGVQQYLLSSGGKDLDDNMVRDITMDSPLSAFLTLSKAGLCAYFGITELSNVSEGECVFVTGGTGCVGSFVPQVVRASLSDKKIKEGIKNDETHHEHVHKSSPSSVGNHTHNNGEKTSLCSSSHCLIPHRSCNKAKSPTLSWLFSSLIEEENEEEYDLSHSNNEDEEHFPKSSHEVISREDEPSEATHFIHDPIVTPHGHLYHSPEEMKHGHHLHLPHHTTHHHPYLHNVERLNLMNSSASSHKNPPQIKIFGFCSSDSKKSLMTNKLKYDNAINYSNYMKKKNTSESGASTTDDPLNSPCASCLIPAWSSVSPFTHVYGASTGSSCSVLQDQPADTCLLKTGQRYDYSKIDRAALSKAIGEMCPDGIDVVFDTVGGVLLDLCLEHLKTNARIVICGAIANSNGIQSFSSSVGKNENEAFEGPHNYVNLILKCARMEGFMVEKFQSKFKQASHTLVRWIQEKKIDSLEENVIECDLKDRTQVINAIEKLFSGEYYGKLIVRVKQSGTLSSPQH